MRGCVLRKVFINTMKVVDMITGCYILMDDQNCSHVNQKRSDCSSNLHLEKNQTRRYTSSHQFKRRSRMRFFSSLITLGVLGTTVWWVNDARPELKYKFIEIVHTRTFQTLEARFTPKQIMDKERDYLLQGNGHQYGEPALKFHPYVLMEVKFTQNNFSTKEGLILWDLIDGEMVIDATTWEKTHGFADCIYVHADRRELGILNLLAQYGGSADRQMIMSAFNVEQSLIETWLERCLKKKLIVCYDGIYRIHLQEPKIPFLPLTQIDAPLVTKNCKHTERIPPHFSSSQIKRLAKATFGNDFAIRSAMDIFIPIYIITVENPDGSTHTTHWNALTGQRMVRSSLFE